MKYQEMEQKMNPSTSKVKEDPVLRKILDSKEPFNNKETFKISEDINNVKNISD